MIQDFWYSSGAAGGGGDPGVPIGNSLRFRGGQTLTNNGTTTTGTANLWTLSWWVKYTQSNVNGTFIFHANEGANSVGNISILSSSNDGGDGTITLNCGNGGNGFQPTRRFRDPNAWYHMVLAYNGANQAVSFTVNGEPVTTGVGTLLTTSGVRIDRMIFGRSAFDGYLADIHFIDGQALEPTSFGRTNDNGVWVPVNYTGTYGTNGFHLDFHDPDNLGEDVSGQNNHFTPAGFNTNPVGVFSNQMNNPDGWLAAPSDVTRAFDGDTASCAQSAGDADFFFNPTTPISFTNGAFVMVNTGGDSTMQTNLNGAGWVNTETPGAIGSWNRIATGAGTITTLGFRRTSANEPNLCAIAINGTATANILVDRTSRDYDSMQDSPTQNFATINPLNVTGPAFNPNTKDANLGANTSQSQADWASTCNVAITRPSYFEGTFVTHCSIGVAESNVSSNTRCLLVAGSGTAYTQDNMGSQSNVNVGLPGTLAAGTIGCRVDPANRTVAWTYDGTTWSNNITYNAVTNPVMPYISAGVAQPSNTDLFINLGQQPFVHPVPAGFEPVQTQTMSEPTILNGRDHFRALVGQGQGNNGATAGQLGGNWSQDCFNLPYAANTTPNLASIPTLTSQNNFSGPAWAGFDGTSNDDFLVSPGAAVFRPSTPIENVTQVVCQQFSGQRNALNGTDLGNTSASNSNEVIYNGPAVTLESWTAWSVNAGASDGGWWTLKVRINGGDLLTLVDFSILAQAQNTFPNGLWWIKDRENDSTQHQLVDSIRGSNLAVTCPTKGGQIAYNAPAGNSVAWCWGTDATGVNADAGFQILTYTGTDAAPQVIPHSLDATRPLDLVIVKGYDAPGSSTYINNANWMIWCKGMQPNNYAYMNSDGAMNGTANSFWTATGLNTTLGNLTVGSDPDVNNGPGVRGGAIEYVAYLWQEVPGYSSFGTFNGNGSSNGTYIHLGFRPAFFMWKRYDGSGNYEMRDTTRHTTNPDEFTIYANREWREAGPDSNQSIDILSSGVKIRNGQSNMNQGTLIYIAFAENPFGGSNTVPANAR